MLGRWEFINRCSAGNDMFCNWNKLKNDYPRLSQKNGIELGEENSSYEVNVYKSIMYLTFKSD